VSLPEVTNLYNHLETGLGSLNSELKRIIKEVIFVAPSVLVLRTL
jgi:hypothetical protein